MNTGVEGGRDEVGGGGGGAVLGEEVEGVGVVGSCGGHSAPLVVLLLPPMLWLVLLALLGEEGAESDSGAPLEEEEEEVAFPLDSSFTTSPSLLLPSPHSSLSRVGEEGVEGGCWCFLALRLASLKLASGGRSLTPLRVEPSMAFCSCWEE